MNWIGILLGLSLAGLELALYARHFAAYDPVVILSVVGLTVLLLVGAVSYVDLIAEFSSRIVSPRDERTRSTGLALLHGLAATVCSFVTLFSWATASEKPFLVPQGSWPPSWSMISLMGISGFVGIIVVSALNKWREKGFWFSWPLLSCWLVAAAVRIMYAKVKVAGVMHAGVLMCLFVVIAFRPHPFRSLDRSTGKIALFGIGVLASGMGLASNASHATRLLLHERSRISFRILQLSPFPARSRPACDLATEGAEDHDSNGGTEQKRPSNTRDFPQTRGVVFVMLDTLRADVLGRRYRGREVSPRLREFLETSIHYERAYTTTPATRPTTHSFFVDTPVRRGDPLTSLGRALRNFDHYVAMPIKPGVIRGAASPKKIDIAGESQDTRFITTSKRVTQEAVERVEKLPDDERFFLFVHYFDPHEYYVENDRFDYGSSREADYLAEVSYTDYWFGRLIDRLEATGLDDVAVIVASDHGEELWDHGYIKHNYALYEESTHVPIGIRHPDVDADRVSEPVDFDQLAPTIAGMLDLVDKPKVESALPPWGNSEDLVELKVPPKIGAVTDGWKAIFDRQTGVAELYDLRDDPGERRNLADEKPEKWHSMLCRALTRLE